MSAYLGEYSNSNSRFEIIFGFFATQDDSYFAGLYCCYLSLASMGDSKRRDVDQTSDFYCIHGLIISVDVAISVLFRG